MTRFLRTNPAIQVFMLAAALFYGFLFAVDRWEPAAMLRGKLVDGLYRARYEDLKSRRGGGDSNPVVVVSIDDASLRTLGERWPWSRKVFADFLERVSAFDPSTVGFDLSFSVPSVRGEEDAAFEAAIRKSGNTVLSAYEGSGGGIVHPLAAFERAAAGTGVLNTLRDADDTNRRFRPFWPSGSGFMPSFAAAVVARSGVFSASDWSARLGPPTGESRMASYDWRPEDLTVVPFWRLIKDDAEAAGVRGKILLVGATGEIFHDTYRTPLGMMPGVMIHANQALSLLAGRPLKAPDPARLKTAALAASLAFAFVLLMIPGGWSVAAFAAALAAVFQGVRLAFVQGGCLVDPLTVYAALAAAAASVWIYRFVRLVVENRGLRRQSSKDGLTDLYTYRYMEARLISEFDRSQASGIPLSFVIFDIDHFKKLNDQYGHEKGNEILVAFARILKANTRGDDLVARYGGEEFCLVLPHRPSEEALQIAERIRASLESSRFRFSRKGEAETSEIGVTVSAGICSSDSRGAFNGKELLRLADYALLSAKRNGRNRIEVFRPE